MPAIFSLDHPVHRSLRLRKHEGLRAGFLFSSNSVHKREFDSHEASRGGKRSHFLSIDVQAGSLWWADRCVFIGWRERAETHVHSETF